MIIMSDIGERIPATEEQKEKLRFFGCAWDEGITKRQASDALEECARQFPDLNKLYNNRPASKDQLAKLRSYLDSDEEPDDYYDSEDLNYGEAEKLIRTWEREKQRAYDDSDESKIVDETFAINLDYCEDDHRKVTRDEVTQAWALVKSRKSESPNTQDLLDALEEIVPGFKQKKQQTPLADKLPLPPSERSQILENKLAELVADGEFAKNDEKELTALAIQLGFNQSHAAELQKKKFAEEFEPIKQRIEKTHLLTDEDWEAIEHLKKKYDIQLTMEGNATMFRSIYLIESKKQLPAPISTSLMLDSGEVVYYSIPTAWYQAKVLKPKTPEDFEALETIDGIMKRSGIPWTSSQATTQLDEISEGVLYVTSERLLFCGGTENTDIGLKKIVDCHFYSDFLKVDKSVGKSDLFSMNSPEARYIIALVHALK